MFRRVAGLLGFRIWEVFADSEVVYWTVHEERAITVEAWARYQAEQGVTRFAGKVIGLREASRGAFRNRPGCADKSELHADPGRAYALTARNPR